MIRLTYSNRTEALLEALVAQIDARRRHDPLAPTWIVVPNRNVERYAELGVARHLGIAANLRFVRLAQLVRQWLDPTGPLLVETALSARVLRALLDDALLSRAVMAPVRRYLDGAGSAPDAIDLRRVELALHVARLFEEYGFSRPELLAAWDRGEARFGGPHGATEAWQAELWRALRGMPSSAGLRTLAETLDGTGALAPPAEALHVFGLSYVARIFARFYAALGARSELYLYALNPCEEYWEDLETAGELRRRRRESEAEPEWLWEDDPFRLSVDTETPLLRLWGRPGREHVRLLGALTDCDFSAAFIDPIAERAPAPASVDALPLFASLETPSLLHRLQRDVLLRTPRAERPDPDARRDPSVQVFACPSIRREVETVAAEIWSLIETLDDLTFDQIAVLVNGPDRDLYLPHLSAVFEEAHRIPFNVADLSLASASPLVECALRLLALPASRFTRPELLSVITHPAVRPAEIDAHEWARLSDRLGIFHGLDHAAHEGTYVEEDLLNWEQGLVRVALGAFMAGEASGDTSFVRFEGSRYLPEEAPVGDGAPARFALLVRSLASDARFARGARLSLTEWARFFAAMATSYLAPEDEREEGALRRVLEAITTLADHDLDGTPVSYTIAHELAKEAIGALGGRGAHVAGGVAVSSLVPMRAIPFRAIFVLGLGEGRFPAADRRDSMDLRAARRQLGDVTPPERDRYTFLETLLCARERLYVSYVARDEQTGDPLAPSTVVQELLEVIEASYLPRARDLVVHPTLRRHDDERMVRVLPEAAAEARAKALGGALTEQLRRDHGEALHPRLARPEVLRRAARDDAVARALALAPLPERADAVSEATLRLSLASLRRFLECPLQGWTRSVLRLEEDELDGAFALADEPFAPSALEATIALRASFAAHVVSGVALADAYAAEVAPRKARGRWPVGALEQLAARDHAEVLERWRRALDALREAEPGARFGTTRFGSAETDEASVQVLDPIVIPFDDDPRAPGSGRALRVELVGRTDLLMDGPRSSILPLLRRGVGTRGRVTGLRHALRAFFDHVALSASGREVEVHRAVHLAGDDDDARPSVIAFEGLTSERAMGYLGGLVRELLARRHAYLMPCESVLRLADRWDGVRGEELVASVEEVRDRWDGGQSRFGPVRDALGYPPLAPGDAEDAAERRFGLFLRSIRDPEAR